MLNGCCNKQDASRIALNTYEKTKDGWTVMTNAYLFQLMWDDSIAAIFYNDLWVDKNKVDTAKSNSFFKSDLFKLEYSRD